MRVIFAGTPEFARVALQAIHAAGFDLALVLSQPDRPGGRGMKLQASAVKQWALGLPQPVAVCQPRSLRLDGKYPDDAAAARDAITAAQADIMVVAAYGLILPQWVLDAPRLGCLNIHGSLLPRWRGAAPIHRAIEAGDAETGITIMQMDAGLDTGDMLLTERLPIAPDDSTATLHDKLAALGGEMIVRALALAGAGQLQPVRQSAEGVTYAAKIAKAESQIVWSRPAVEIERSVRAMNPFPVMAFRSGDESIKVWHAAIEAAEAGTPTAPPGTVLSADACGVRVQCGDGVLTLLALQRPGGKRLPAADFLRGFALQPGASLG